MDLTTWARRQPGKTAVVTAAGDRLTYAELEEQSNRTAHLLRDLGLGPGDHIAVIAENRIDVFPLVWAAQRSGLRYTLVNWHLTASEAAYVVENCGARALVLSAELAGLAAELPAVPHRLSLGGPIAGYDGLEELTAHLPGTPIRDQSEGYYMLYSSGTTGRPKGILPDLPEQPFGTGLAIDHTMATHFGFDENTVYLSPGPLYHAAPLGWSLGTQRNGGTVVLMDRFDAETVLRLVAEHRVTHAQFVPTMFVRMLKLPEQVRTGYDLTSLRLVVHAAAPCPVEVKRRMIDWLGPVLVEFYSGSEGVCFYMIDSPTWLEHPGSVGQSVLGTVRVCDDQGNELPAGEVGQLWFSGAPAFRYHGDSAKTAAAFDAAGRATLGDLGYVDDDGFLYLSDRRTDLIISGGVNIYPREIEDLLVLHPAVADVAVIGLPDAEYGQRVHAVVTPAPDTAPGPELADELLAHLRPRLAPFKLPQSFDFAEVPRLPSGKVLRRALLAEYGDAAHTPNTPSN